MMKKIFIFGVLSLSPTPFNQSGRNAELSFYNTAPLLFPRTRYEGQKQPSCRQWSSTRLKASVLGCLAAGWWVMIKTERWLKTK